MEPVERPQELPGRWSAAYNAGDLEGLFALYCPDAIKVLSPTRQVSGDELRAHLAWMVSRGGRMTQANRDAFVRGNIALLVGHWRSQAQSEGRDRTLAGNYADVARYDDGFGWRYLIDGAFASM